jgi:hypothetical protein
LTLFFWSHADGISTAVRTNQEEPFGDVANLGPPISRTGVDREYDAWPDISSDGLTLFFASLRPGINTQWRDLFVATRDSIDAEFGEPINLDEFGLGSDVNSEFRGNCCIVDPNISSDWPALGSKLYYQVHKTTESGGKIFEATWIPEISGDYSGDSALTDLDINLLSRKVVAESHPFGFDLNEDELVDQLDRQKWVQEIKSTWFGDANLDGEFNSGDMVGVFQAGKYEVAVDAGWAEGDWTGDQRFDSGDFIAAFQDGGYELGPRVAVNAVPEPTGVLLFSVGIIGICRLRIGRIRSRYHN